MNRFGLTEGKMSCIFAASHPTPFLFDRLTPKKKKKKAATIR
jgi:hypothetical protein